MKVIASCWHLPARSYCYLLPPTLNPNAPDSQTHLRAQLPGNTSFMMKPARPSWWKLWIHTKIPPVRPSKPNLTAN